MNSLMRNNPAASRPWGSPLERNSFAFDGFLDRLFSQVDSAGRIMNSHTKEDGTRVLEFNLAGFRESDIEVKLDKALHEVVIRADRSSGGRQEKFATAIAVSPHMVPEDLAVAYDSGVLYVELSPVEKRQDDSLVSIPLTARKEEFESTKDPASAEEAVSDEEPTTS